MSIYFNCTNEYVVDSLLSLTIFIFRFDLNSGIYKICRPYFLISVLSVTLLWYYIYIFILHIIMFDRLFIQSSMTSYFHCFSVAGQWSSWSRWLDCSVSCGAGIQNRFRTCDGASNGGGCGGNTTQNEYQSCNSPCPG